MRKTQLKLQLLRSLGVTIWHRQAGPVETADSPLPLLIIAPAISDFMMHQVLFKRILGALSLPENSWRVIHAPEHFEDACYVNTIWVIGDAGILEDSLPTNTIYSPPLGMLESDVAAKKRLWEQLKSIDANVSQ